MKKNIIHSNLSNLPKKNVVIFSDELEESDNLQHLRDVFLMQDSENEFTERFIEPESKGDTNIGKFSYTGFPCYSR